jgi:large subunit ribosomal protein L28
MAKCELCGKIGRAGNNVSHSKRRTSTRFMPNIQHATLTIKGNLRKVTLCTRCLRTNHKMPKAVTV